MTPRLSKREGDQRKQNKKKKKSKENELSALARKFRKRNTNSILPPFQILASLPHYEPYSRSFPTYKIKGIN